MAYRRRLIHTCAVHRPAVTRGETGKRQASYSVVTGLESVRCLLVEGDAGRLLQEFGPELQCDALVLFERGVDLKPNPREVDGQNDMLVVTDESSRTSKWVVAASKDVASARGMIAAAVRRVAR